MNENVIAEINNVSKKYKKYKLIGYKEVVGVDNINFVIKRNEIFGLLGLNGSGKTTTIKLLIGLIYPDKGIIKILGNDVPNWKIHKHIGYLPEVISFNKNFSGKELLYFYSKLSNQINNKNKIDEIIEFVGLSANINRNISEYSKGMLQRLGIAQALISNPDFVIFDEPSSGLDPLGIKEIRDLILKLKEQGKTIFFSSHLISELEKVCDRVAIIHHGKIINIVNNSDWQNKNLEDILLESINISTN